jgi:hypothetical protein
MKKILSYIKAHWRGQLSVAQSFWMNMVVFGLLIGLSLSVPTYLLTGVNILQDFIIPDLELAIVWITVVEIILLFYVFWSHWGFAMSAYKLPRESFANTLIIGFATLMLLFIPYSTYTTFQFIDSAYELELLISLDEQKDATTQNNEIAEITVDKENAVISITGSIDEGLSNRFLNEIIQAGFTKDDDLWLYITSEGGDIIEPFHFGKILREYEVSVIPWDYCYSACASIYLEANIRGWSSDASTLGFHRYYETGKPNKLDGQALKVLNTSFKRWREIGISEAFISTIIAYDGEEVYEPTQKELIQNSIITHVLSENTDGLVELVSLK